MTKLLLAFLMGLLFLVPLYPAHPHAVNGVDNHSMVDILDPELRKVVAGEFLPPKAPTDPITADDMKLLPEITADRKDIRHIRGLDHAINLTRLQLLRSIPRTNADLNARPRFNLEILSGLTELESLTLQGVVIFDMAPLANLTKLKDLGLQYTYGISEIPDLSKLTGLVHLVLTRNRITDIAGLRGLTNLRQLSLSSNSNLSDISPLTQLRNLERLGLSGTAITREDLSAVLPFFSTEVDQGFIGEYPPVSIRSGVVGFNNTNISDLSVLDSLPNVFLWGLYLRFMGTQSSGTFAFHLTDLTPLVDLMNKGKVINSLTTIYLGHNYGLDYESLYEDIPALIAGSRRVERAQPNPMLEREFPKAASYSGYANTRYTFKVRAVNTNPTFPDSWRRLTPQNSGVNRQFAKVPVTWKVTAPDGTVTQTQTPTGDDGLSSVTITLGDDGEAHTVEAVVPAKTTSEADLSHAELKVTFTATAAAPPVITLTLDNVGYTHIQWIADVSGTLPQAYVHYYKKSANREWIKVENLRYSTSRFSFVHSDLEPGTSYDFQLFALSGGSRIEPGSNVLTARTLSRTPPRPPPEPPTSSNRPPVFRSASAVSVPENTTAVIMIVAEDPDAEDVITGYAITGGADASSFEIGGTNTPVDMLRFKATPDFEMPGSAANSNVYTVILTATSGVGDRELTATQTLTITVTDVDETVDPPIDTPNNPPAFTSASAVSVPENTTRVVTVVAEDPDAEDAITGYAITGGADRTLFVISGTRTPADMLRFRTAPDFEMPGSAANSNVYTLILTATSGVGNRELMVNQTLTITVTDVDEPIEPPVDPPVDPPIVGEGASGGAESPIPLGTQSFIFNEIGNFSDDTNDWIELKNVCNTPLELSEWQLRLITTEIVESGAEIDVVSLPEFVLPAQGLLLITNTDPNENHLASGLNIATGARQKGAQHLYFVAPDLKLPSTPFLLILQRTASANRDLTIADLAGNYFWYVLPYDSEVYPFSDTSDSTEETAPLTQFGAWQRQRLEDPGYLAAAWVSSGYHAHLGYDRHAPALLCLGTPGYRLNPSPAQPVTHRLVFNEVRNASDDINDWIELKNVCGTDIHLKDWKISIVRSTGETAREEVDIVSFPDYTLPMGGVLLITNTDPEETVVAGGLNIATGKRQHGAQHLYLVAPDLQLPSTPYLLILRYVQEKDEDFVRTIEDVAGNYFWALLSYDTELYSFPSHPTEVTAPLTDFGAWQRQRLEDPGYLAAAWVSSGYHGHLGYDRHALASMCLGTPGYRRDFSPVLPVVSRVVFNKVRNAADNTNDWIELKNICGTDVRLRDWEISIVRSIGVNADQDVDIVSFPDYILPAQGLLLITNIDPSKTWLTSGLNIAASEQQTNAQHPYLVAPDLKLPDTPYLLILRHARGKNGTPESIEDVAGNYFRIGNNTEVWPLADTHRPSAPVVQLSWGGTWQRIDIRERGYLAAAWTEIQSQYEPIASDTLPVVYRVVFNKIRNASDDANDWIELKNIYGTDVNLRDWEISIVASTGKYADQDVDIVSFPDYTLPIGGVLLITNTDPDETVIIDGLNIIQGAKWQQSEHHPYLVAPDLKLPNTPYLLILRQARGRNGTPESIADVAGNYFRNNMEVWPLANTRRPSTPAAPLSEVGNWQRKDATERGYLAAAWTVNQSPPGISDTPNALDDRENLLFAPNANAAAVVFNPTLPDEVRITELMTETKGSSDALPQWIELYNASQTSVDLNDWQLGVETRTDGTHQHATLTLKSFLLPPKQTVILVTGQGESSDALPTDRVYDLSEEHPDAFSKNLKSTLIGTEGFSLKLLHPTGRVVDSCGNLDGDKDTDDQPTWTLPDSKTPQGHRFSLLRRFDGDVLRGTKASGWMPATTVAIGINAYYGHPTDIATPCSLHQIVPGTSPTVALSISEIMFETKTRTLPQWIELYNPSFTDAVKLKDYQLIVETRQEGKHHQIVMTLEAFDVLPNQTALLVTARGAHSKHLTDNRIYNLSQRHSEAFSPLLNRSRLLSSEGFLIQLSDATGNIVDTIGNLDGYLHTKDTSAWTLPPGETKDGARASLRRLYKKRQPLDGRHAKAWVSTADVPPKIITYYGHASDVGNPMYRKGTPLPVTLSSFSAVWHTDNVVISWTTESELDNAGFNILRSRTKTGVFRQINTKLVQGAGTTGQRTEYTWTDITAKPNTVYYYRLEDVSYAGAREQSPSVRMKEYISAANRQLMRWADLKKNR